MALRLLYLIAIRVFGWLVLLGRGQALSCPAFSGQGICGYFTLLPARSGRDRDGGLMAARNLDLPEGAIFHSDRGSNYTSAEFGEKLRELGIKRSVGRTGICYDNALSESVNGTLKNELVYRTAYRTRKAATDDIARWIELRYNRTRLHSTLGYRTPQEVLDEYLNVAIQPEWRCLVCPELRGHTTQLPASQELTALLGDMSCYGR